LRASSYLCSSFCTILVVVLHLVESLLLSLRLLLAIEFDDAVTAAGSLVAPPKLTIKLKELSNAAQAAYAQACIHELHIPDYRVCAAHARFIIADRWSLQRRGAGAV
jgi:hypothetical protein